MTTIYWITWAALYSLWVAMAFGVGTRLFRDVRSTNVRIPLAVIVLLSCFLIFSGGSGQQPVLALCGLGLLAALVAGFLADEMMETVLEWRRAIGSMLVLTLGVGAVWFCGP